MDQPTCTVDGCESAPKWKNMCVYHYQRAWRKSRPKIKCSIENCDKPARTRGWCGMHYQRWKYGNGLQIEKPPRILNKLVPCMNCGKEHSWRESRQFCSDNCRTLYKIHGGPRPDSVHCTSCGIEIDLNFINPGGKRRKADTKRCSVCKTESRNYGMSAAELARRDGTDCGICGDPVDMTLRRRDDENLCPSVDHILPRSLGGGDEPENLRLTHNGCNRIRGNRILT